MNCVEAFYTGDVLSAERQADTPQLRAMLLSNAQRYEEAYQELIKVKDKDSETYIGLISACKNLKRSYGHFINKVDIEDDGIALAVSEMYADSEMYQQAINVLSDIITKHNAPHLKVILAKYYLDNGDFNKSVEILSNCIIEHPTQIPAYGNLYALIDLQVYSEHFNFIKSSLNSIAIPTHIKLSLHGILASCYEKSGMYKKAFSHYEAMYTEKRKEFPFNALLQIKSLSNSLSNTYSQKLIDKVDVPESANPMIFVCGMPRSGTTLVEQILVTHSEIGTLGETPNVANKIFELADKLNNPVFTNKLPEFQYEIGDSFVTDVIKNCKDKRIVDKMPHNFLYLGAIYQLMPTAKVVYVKRNMNDCCFSCLTTNFADGHGYSYSPKEMFDYYELHNKVVAHWKTVLPESFFYEIKYESVVTDFEIETRKLMKFVGLDYESIQAGFHETKRQVKTASVAQVNKPLYSSSIGRSEPFLEYMGVRHD